MAEVMTLARYVGEPERIVLALQRAAISGMEAGVRAAVDGYKDRSIDMGVHDLWAYVQGWDWVPVNVFIEPSFMIFNEAPHAVYVELGRRPNSGFPPVDAMREWVARKLGVAAGLVNSVAFLVGRKIADDGIDPRPVMALEHSRAAQTVMSHIQAAMNRVR